MKKTNPDKLNNKISSRLGSRKGMTMAEMLVTVAIIIILMGVAFIALTVYQRNLAQKERDTIAREIFVAAQNHLTMSRGEGYTGIENYGTPDPTINAGSAESDVSKAPGVYYYTVKKGDLFTDDESQMIDVMLPFGSIDETVRTNGCYIIRYEPETATVVDVFYTTVGTGSKFDYDLKAEGAAGLSDLLAIRGEDKTKKDARKNFEDGSVLGWYGGADLERLPYDLVSPQVSVVNGDKLVASVTNHNFTKPNPIKNGLKCKLIVTGVTSEAKMAVLLDKDNQEAQKFIHRLDSTDFSDDKCLFVLDSVTEENSHFSDLTTGVVYLEDKRFIPGEDIKVEAVAYSDQKLCRIRFSEAKTTNSLYESIQESDSGTTAFISSFRHLENLDPALSNVGKVKNDEQVVTTEMEVKAAKQTDDLVWGGKDNIFNKNCTVYGQTASTSMFHPVSPDAPIKYDGLDYSIQNITVNYTGSAGIFGEPAAGSEFSNLKIIDAEITAGGNNNAGSLAGTLTGGEVDNVISYNRSKEKYKEVGVEATGGTAGGLIGKTKGTTVKYSAASVQVSGADNAGGLIGHADAYDGNGSTVTACYAGGHTDNGEYYTHDNNGKRVNAFYNIYANGGAAGGLIGNAGGASISYSYSTCSVDGDGDESGGFVGIASGSINHCYSLGHVSGTKNNGFIGRGTISGSELYYLEITNDYQVTRNGKKTLAYKGPGSSKVKAMDEDETSYRKFYGYTKKAVPYDKPYLSNHYPGGKYIFKTVTELQGSGNTDKLVNVHYGDWPSPEIYIINQ